MVSRSPRTRRPRAKGFRRDYLVGIILLVILALVVGFLVWQGLEKSKTRQPILTVPPRPAATTRLRQPPVVDFREEEPSSPLPPPVAAAVRKPDPPAATDIESSSSPILYEEHFTGREAPTPSLPPMRKPRLPPRRPGTLVPVAVVIDDLGYHASVSKAIAKLPADITLAVLPGGPTARQVAEIGHSMGKEVILHQPMEPMEYPRVSPGPGAILTSMSESDIRQVVQGNLDRFPEAVGLNNHMGSRITTHPTAMAHVMKVLRQRGLFFLDSRTSQHSVAYDQALQAGVPAAYRHVFIDNVQRVEAILGQLRQLEAMALGQGGAVGIGHPYPETLQALETWLVGLDKRNLRVVRVSSFLNKGRPPRQGVE